jgi:starvation-inducible DNA-binding protein
MSKVTKQLRQIQADAHALFIKIHNYHWNVKGMDFSPVHLKTEEIYNNMALLYDDTAERVIQLGEKPHLTMGALAKATRIEEERGDSFKSKEIVKHIIGDFEYLHHAFEQLSDFADDAKDKATASFADDHLALLEKEIWMLKAMLKS